MEDNPFSFLFNTKDEVAMATERTQKKSSNLSNTLSRIFLIKTQISVNVSNYGKYVISVPRFHGFDDGMITMENYEQVLTMRLQMVSPEEHLVIQNGGTYQGLFDQTKAIEKSKVTYLFHCYSRAVTERTENDPVKGQVLLLVKQVIAKLASVTVCTLHNLLVIKNQDPSDGEFVNLFLSSIRKSGLYTGIDFFRSIAISQVPNNLSITFIPLLDKIYSMSENLSLSSPDLYFVFDCVQFISECPPLAKLLVDSRYWLPVISAGKAYETHCMLGRLMHPSTISTSLLRQEHFTDISFPAPIDVINSITASLQSQLEDVVSRQHTIVSSLVRSNDYVKDRVIIWLTRCFKANSDRGKMLSRLQGANQGLNTASDGFFLNLSWILLRLSLPFSTLDAEGKNPRLNKIDPGYCNILSRKRQRDETNGDETNDDPDTTLRELVIDFSQETKIAHTIINNEASSSSTLSCPTVPVIPIKFITHCFYLTHKCLMLGLTQTIHLYNDTRRMLGRLHHMGVRDNRTRSLYSHLLSIKTHTMDPLLLELCLTFYTATSIWLIQLVKQQRSSVYPLPKQTPNELINIPECLVENLADFAIFLKDYEDDVLDNPHQQRHRLVFCTVFMGHTQLLHNPHLRAKLVQLVSMMVPQEDDPTKTHGLFYSTYLETQKALFESDAVVYGHLLESLLMIFIDIEHTGDSMEFEDKFGYRIPMYNILEYLWTSPAYSDSVKQLTDEAVVELEMTEAPLFLRFINMMINDAIVQLDEGLQNLVTIREVECLQDSFEWNDLSAEEKKQTEDKLSEAVMYASNRNMLAKKTVHSLEVITNDITKPFVTTTMVDRMAAMLNYFLKKLMGPKSKEYDVKDKKKYNFDPSELISGIISVYINLGKEEKFCQAVHRDGRSFSMDLFNKALSVLRRIGKPNEMCVALVKVRERVRKYTQQQALEELLSDNAPDEFLDPILGTLMSDPVLLTTSGNTVDRSTIVRHLLSEQFDPFNRVPLTVDMLKPQDELRARIEDWKAEKINKLP